jgi:alcohol dehydrogenase, propanol-preferring
METMKAYKLVQWGQEGEFVEIPKPSPGPSDVLIRVKAVGLCHSDIDMMESQPGSDPYATSIDAGYVLGHETTGIVEEVGESVKDLKKLETVVVRHMMHCGFCESREAGIEQHCTHYRRGAICITWGCGLDGGLAQYLVVPRTEVISVGTGDPVFYAPPMDAGVTAYAGCRTFLSKLRPGMTALVIGVGGLGSFAVQFLKLLSPARVVAIDTNPTRLDHARSLGADGAFLSDDKAAAKLNEITGGKGADAIIDLVGSNQTLALAVKAIRPQGNICVVGMAGGTVNLGWNRITTSASFMISLGSSRKDLREVFQLVSEGKLRIDVERFSFDDIPKAYERLRTGQLQGRAVVVMD